KSSLDKKRHVDYWLRYLHTYLPAAATSNDSNRILLAFFIVSALDLLGSLQSRTTADERASYTDWIYHCQHSQGGFRGFTGTDFGTLRSEENAHWDPANLPATYFALAALLVLGDDLSRVKRRECLEWLPKLQRPDGSFGETLAEGARIEGGRDMRFCNCAAGVRQILRGKGTALSQDIKDINFESMVRYIRASETYDGGVSEGPYHEAHAGFTYCAIGALSFLGRLSTFTPEVERLPPSRAGSERSSTMELSSLSATIHWLVSRQTTVLEEDEYVSSVDHPIASASNHKPFSVLGAMPAPTTGRHPDALAVQDPQELRWAGFNGRCNKNADTCYSWWVGGSLAILNKVHLMNFNANRRYLLEKTQHVVGGFGKLPGEDPDLLHSYFGLAALACMKEPELRSIDPTFCISVHAREHLESLPWWVGNEDAKTSSTGVASRPKPNVQ
ncbi:MAG: hypothetical protein M1830_001875, partial [Pleopsidium flavum]